MTPERELLLQAIRKAGKPVGPGELAARLGKASGAIRKMLNTLKQAGQVKQVGYGKWQAVTLDGNTTRKAVTLPGNTPGQATVTVSGNTSGRAVTLQAKGGLSDTEKIAIARREYNQGYYAKHRRELQALSREWKKAHPEKIKAQRQRIWIKKYNQAHPKQ